MAVSGALRVVVRRGAGLDEAWRYEESSEVHGARLDGRGQSDRVKGLAVEQSVSAPAQIMHPRSQRIKQETLTISSDAWRPSPGCCRPP